MRPIHARCTWPRRLPPTQADDAHAPLQPAVRERASHQRQPTRERRWRRSGCPKRNRAAVNVYAGQFDAQFTQNRRAPATQRPRSVRRGRCRQAQAPPSPTHCRTAATGAMNISFAARRSWPRPGCERPRSSDAPRENASLATMTAASAVANLRRITGSHRNRSQPNAGFKLANRSKLESARGPSSAATRRTTSSRRRSPPARSRRRIALPLQRPRPADGFAAQNASWSHDSHRATRAV